MVCCQWYRQNVPGDEERGCTVLGRCPDERHSSTIHHERGATLRFRSHPTFHWFWWSRETFPADVWFDGIWPILRHTVHFLPWNNEWRFYCLRERGQPLWLLSILLWPNRVRAVITAINIRPTILCLRSNSDVQCIRTIPNVHLRTDKPTIGFWPN
jgi:hypothetical protein